jgi:hypothetical protein
MTLYETVEDYLTKQPLARERKHKDRGLVNLIIARHGLQDLVDSRQISKEKLIEMVHDFTNLDRLWRKVTETRPDLRGSDYNDKDALEAATMSELGYVVNPKEEQIDHEVQRPMI